MITTAHFLFSFTLFLLIFCGSCIAQTEEIFYFDTNYALQNNAANHAYKAIIRSEGKHGKNGVFIKVLLANGQILQQYAYTNFEEMQRMDTLALWYENGNPKYIRIYDNNGLLTYSTGWHESGKLQFESFYSSGKLNGTSTYYFENGAISTFSKHKYGTLIDTSREFFEQGNISFETIYHSNGKKMRLTSWNPDGSMRSQITFNSSGDTVESKNFIPAEPFAIREPDTYSFVERQPEYPGGIKELFGFIGTNIQYPVDARDNGIEGKVYVKFIIDADGKITKLEVREPFYPTLDFEAMRVIRLIPEWQPGMQNGKAVSVYYTIPVSFKLE